MVDGNASRFDGFDEVQQTVQRVEIGFQLRDLRTDVAVDAHHPQARQRRGVAVGGHRFVVRNAELVALESRGDVGVRARIDIGVDAQAHRRSAAQGARFLVQRIDLAQAFDVEAAHTGQQGLAHVGAGLANAREDHLRRVAASNQHPRQFTAGHDVKTAACLRKGLQHGQRGVGLHRVTQQMPPALQGPGVRRQCRQHGRARIDEERCAEALRQRRQGMAFQPQFTGFARKVRGTRKLRQIRQVHRAPAEAALAAAAAACAAGKVSGPFWPQADTRTTSPAHNAVSAADRGRLDTLLTAETGMQRIL